MGIEEYLGSVFYTIRKIREVNNDQRLGFWMIISILIEIISIVTRIMISIGNPLDYERLRKVSQSFWVTL